MKKPLNRLHLEWMIGRLREHYVSAEDTRKDPEKGYPLGNVIMGSLAMLFLQDPALASFQRRIHEQTGSNNLLSLFQIDKIPGESQFRRLLDPVDPEFLAEGIHLCVRHLQSHRFWKRFRLKDGQYAVLIDATETHRSEEIHCPQCLRFEHSDGRIEYAHRALAAVLVHPDLPFAIPLLCEEIRNGDGQSKQDCEFKAAKRLLPKLAKIYCHLDMVIVGDGLYSKVPMVELCQDLHLKYLFVAKPADHVTLEENLAGLRLSGGVDSLSSVDEKGRSCRYEFAHQIPITLSSPMEVNWISITQEGSKSKKNSGYHNTWITNLRPDRKNVEDWARVGRSRSKIENEAFNALKNHGYHLEHSYGHGNQHLAFNMILLNITAFVMHQLMGMLDTLYQAALERTGARYQLWEKIRVAVELILWPNWRELFHYLLGYREALVIEAG